MMLEEVPEHCQEANGSDTVAEPSTPAKPMGRTAEVWRTYRQRIKVVLGECLGEAPSSVIILELLIGMSTGCSEILRHSPGS